MVSCHRTRSRALIACYVFSNTRLWPVIYKICNKTIQDNTIIWFQITFNTKFYIIFYPQGATYINLNFLILLDLCGLCGESIETILHLFTECPKVNALWENLKQWLFIKIHIQTETSNILKLFGYLIQDQNFCPLNCILLIARKYIFWCSQKKTDPKIELLKTKIKMKYIEQEHFSRITFSEPDFSKKWNRWKDVFY